MNDYCFDIDLNIDPMYEPLSTKRRHLHVMHPISIISQALIDLLDTIDIGIEMIESFYCPPNYSSVIHADTKFNTDIAKMNWVYYGTDSDMKWYHYDGPVRSHTVASTNTNYRKYDIDEVTCIHSQRVGYPSIVQVGVPHNVVTKTDKRLCLSIFLNDTRTNTLLTFDEAKKRFDTYRKQND